MHTKCHILPFDKKHTKRLPFSKKQNAIKYFIGLISYTQYGLIYFLGVIGPTNDFQFTVTTTATCIINPETINMIKTYM